MTKRIRLRLLLVSLSVTLTLATGRAFASQIAYEGFDYLPGLLNLQNGGIGFTGSWTADPGVMVVPPGLSSPFGLAPKGLEIGGGFNASRRLAAPLSQSEYWVSFQLQEGSPNDQVWLGLDVVPTSTPLIWFGRRLDFYFIALGPSVVATCCVGSPLGVTDFMVARFRQVAPLITEVAVWLNTDNFALAPNLFALMTTVPFLELNMEVQPGLFADEVRIGTTAADVADVANVPETGSLTLLATGILGGIGVLRRKLF
jgi:hypothetical protein